MKSATRHAGVVNRAKSLPAPGTAVRLAGGYDFIPAWLGDLECVTGTIAKWILGQNASVDCVILLSHPLTAEGDVRGSAK